MSFAISTYLVVVLSLTAIGIAVHNFVRFVAKGGKCTVTRPLFIFYILILLALISNILYTVYIVKIYSIPMPFLESAGPTFQLLSGIEQIWMMIELTIHINVEINSHRRINLHSERVALESVGSCIRTGRIIILLFILFVIATMIIASFSIKPRS